MTQETILQLVKELFNTDSLHEEYNSNDTSYVIDVNKDGNTLNISITLDSDKSDFESWLDELDDDFYLEVLDRIENPQELNQKYETEDYHEVIDYVKGIVKELAEEKIDNLKSLISSI